MAQEEIEKTATVSPGMLSTFGSSRYIIDVELTQEEQDRLGFVSGFPTSTIKIKIVCE